MLSKISILVRGNLIAHMFTLIALIVLPSIYNPKAFGLFATFIGVSNILYIILTGRYERALLLPKSEKKANDLYLFTIFLSIFLSILILLLLFLFKSRLEPFFNSSFMNLYIYLVPFYALLLALSETATYYFNRHEEYKKMATSKIILASSSFLASIASDLVMGEIIGRLTALVYMLQMNQKTLAMAGRFPKLIQLKKIAVEYKDFPLKSLSGGTLGMISNSIPLLLIGKIFSLEVAGYYILAYRLLSLPAALFAKSISHVFYKHAILENKAKTLFPFVLKTTIMLFVFSVVSLIIFYSLINFIAELFFSEKWSGMIVIAKIFAPLFAINFIYTCQSSILIVKNKLAYELIFNLSMLIVSISVYTSAYLFDLDYKTTFVLSVVGLILIYFLNILYILKISKEFS